MNLKKAIDEFENYANGYNLGIIGLSRKQHSIRVMKISEEIARNIGMNEEEINLAKLIGLLHDVARFEQWKNFKTFNDKKSRDHGDWGIEILWTDNYIRKFIEEDKYDKIIKYAIKNHNKYQIEEGLNETELLYSKIIRDADKIDILYESVTEFWNDEKEKQQIEQSYISKKVYEDFMNKKLINKNDRETRLDNVICQIAFIHGFNFKISMDMVKKEKYVEKILEKFDFSNNEMAKEQIKQIKGALN